MVFAPFKTFPSHPGHFEQIVSDSTTVEGLKTIIQDHFDKAVTSVAIFKDDTCSKDSFMDPSWHLTCCGVKGASKADPVSVQVFYDYIPALQSCPILSDDSHLHWEYNRAIEQTCIDVDIANNYNISIYLHTVN